MSAGYTLYRTIHIDGFIFPRLSVALFSARCLGDATELVMKFELYVSDDGLEFHSTDYRSVH